MRNSRRSAVDPFIVMDVMHAAARAEAAGRHIIHMEVGQPGTPAPTLARAAVAAALRGFAVRQALAAVTAQARVRRDAAPAAGAVHTQATFPLPRGPHRADFYFC